MLPLAGLGQAPNWTWARGAGNGSEQWGYGIATDTLRNVFITGGFKNSNCNFSSINISNQGGEDIFIAKYNYLGTIQWAKGAGGSSNEVALGIAADNTGASYITGYFENTVTFFGSPNVVLTSTGNRDVFVAKYDASGNIVWAKKGGGTGDDRGLAITTNGASVFVTGYYNATATFGSLASMTAAGNRDAFVVSYDAATGTENWSVSGGSTDHDEGTGIAVDTSGVYVAGEYKDQPITFQNHAGSLVNNGQHDVFLVKYDLSGNGVWMRRAGGSGDDHEVSACVGPGFAYVAGHFSGTMSMYDAGPAAVATVTAAAGDDAFLAQFDATTGNFSWVRSENGTGNEKAWGVACNPAGEIFCVGYFQGILPFGSGPSVSSTGDDDIYVSKYSTTGTFLWGKDVEGSNDDYGRGISAPDNATCYITGYHKSSPSYFGSISVGNFGNDDIFTAKIGCSPLTVYAGPDQTICATSTTLSGNAPITGTGTWTLISGNGTIVSPTSPTTNVTGLGGGANIFRWSHPNGTCPAVYDEVTITRDLPPTTANAGPNQSVCSPTATLAGNTPSVGTGMWTLISGTGTIISPSSPGSTVTGISVGVSVFRWTTSNGICASSIDDVTIIRDSVPTVANAGPDQNICASTTSLAGNTPSIGNGIWTLVSGTGTIVSPSSPGSSVTGIGTGTSIFRWTITNGSCPPSIDDVMVTRDPLSTTANAGPDQTVCSTTATLAGNTPVNGIGTWTLISGSGTITSPNSPTSTVTNLGVGSNIFRWSISSGTCPPSNDQVTITRDSIPTVANAGPDQTICVSNTSMAGNAPSIGTGTWTLISGTGTITAPSLPTTNIMNLGIGANIFRWTISNGTCPPSFDEVIITRDPDPTTAAAGPDQTICASSATLAGNTPAIGTGTWTLVSGTGTVTSPNSPNSGVTGLSVGANVFRWTIANGTCPSSVDEVTITRDPDPTTAAAGPDQALCDSTTTMAGNSPVTGTGMWTLISGTGIISSPSSPTTPVTGLGVGANVFRWTISNGTCPPSMDDVIITRDPLPTTAAAGPDQSLCTSSTTLAGNIPSTGTGTWTLISGTGTISSPNSPNSGVTGLSVGANVFRWTISNGTCPPSFDEVTITRDPVPTTAAAGPDQSLCISTTTMAGNSPVTGTGTWTLISGTGIISSPSSPSTPVTGLGVGANVFRWTISNGTCPPSIDDVIITRDPVPTTAAAGPDQTLCTSSATLAGNTPSTGTGTWTLISGNGTITSPNSPASGVTGLGVGANVFRWTISNGTCPPSFDEVTITRDPVPTTAAAGPDQTLCDSVTTMAANTPVTGTGTWTLISGTGTISSPTSPVTTITSLGTGVNIFRWTISNGTCPPSTDDVVITRDPVPTVAAAGPDQTLCTSATTLAGNTPSTGTGTWTLVTGTGTIVSPNSPNSGVTGLSVGANVFRWTIANGTCPSSMDEVTITREPVPTVAAAGPDQALCDSFTTMAANTPVTGTGMWTLISGTGTITSPAYEATTITNLGIGANVFRWTISNGTCPPSFDEVTITRDPLPTVSNAGPDQTICSSFGTLAGNQPAVGTGTWTLISGTGTIVSPSSPNSSLTGLGVGPNVFRWTISSGTCPSSADDVTVTRNAVPTTANAGPDQSLCSSTATLAGNNPSSGTGAWTLISGTGTITSPNSPGSTVTGLGIGPNVFRWTITSGVCPPSFDDVTITHDDLPTTAAAGTDQNICATTSAFAGNTPAVGTGTWTLVSGSGVPTTPGSPTSGVTGLTVGANTFQWTISNGTCPSSSDQVTITVDPSPTTANAGPDQTVCVSSPGATLFGNLPLTGTGQWTLVVGTGTIQSPGSATTTVTGLSTGANVFQWTITNGTCPPSADQVTIYVDPLPSAANAGADQVLCSSSSLLAGNTPATGSGTWYVINTPATLANPNLSVTAVGGLLPGANFFEWVISSGVCISSRDTVEIYVDSLPTPAAAGPDQVICSTSSMLGGNIPLTGTGQWHALNTGAAFGDSSLAVTSVSNLSSGINLFEWVISNGTCPSSRDTISIQVDDPPSAADAGTSQVLCSSTATLSGVAPTTGYGTWSVISGPATVTNPAFENSGVTNLAVGVNVFEWVVSNGVCPVTRDTVTITVDPQPTAASAGATQTLCNNIALLTANIPATGTGTWYVVSSTGILADSSLATTAVSGLNLGANYFEWVVTNGTCPASRDTVLVFVDTEPSSPAAGSDQAVCDPSATLNGSTPAVGAGAWYTIGNGPSFANPYSPSTTVSNLSPGLNLFEWVITNGTCPPKRDTTEVFYHAPPSMPVAGADISVCQDSVTLQAQPPSQGTGYWGNISGNGIIADTADPFTQVTALPDGMHLFTWCITNGFCPPLSDTIAVYVYSPPSQANAGADQLTYTGIAFLGADQPTTGSGTWTFISGSGVVDDPSNPLTRVSQLEVGINVLRWTTSNGVCLRTDDSVIVENRELVVPTGFSPNQDGVNDNFEINGLLEYEGVSFEVFNRWGNKVFVSADYRNDWNGTNESGEQLPDDIYYYVLSLRDGKTFTGYIAIKRTTP